jgi:hypothetical protein
LLRIPIDDIDLEGGTALIREKKRVRGKLSTRRVPVSPFLNGGKVGEGRAGASGARWGGGGRRHKGSGGQEGEAEGGQFWSGFGGGFQRSGSQSRS